MLRYQSKIVESFDKANKKILSKFMQKSWARYEEAYRIMRKTNDRMGEVLVLGSMAKSASESRIHYTGQCECQVIFFDIK